MNKADFIEAVADHAELTKADAGRAVDAMIAAITKALKKGDTVTLVGFGTFSVRKRGARTGRNPRTGDTIKIKASKNPAFKAGKALKDAVNSSPTREAAFGKPGASRAFPFPAIAGVTRGPGFAAAGVLP